MGTYGHILLEGYCFADTNDQFDYPCKQFSFQRVGYYCLTNNCEHFSFCQCENYIVMTDSNALDIACTSYDEQDQEKIKDMIQKYKSHAL